MIDFHSHILPGMDDGSESVGQSLDMLRIYATQNIDKVIATPHFYRESESVKDFLGRRSAAYHQLHREIADEIKFPEIVPAAEVCFFYGISGADDIDQLCMGESRCLLLELPFEKWGNRVLGEVRALALLRSLTIIIAHVERYLQFGNDKRILQELLNIGAIFQINTNSFIKQSTRRKAFNLLKLGNFIVLGTDTHNTKERPPIYTEACEAIEKKFGVDCVQFIKSLSYKLVIC